MSKEEVNEREITRIEEELDTILSNEQRLLVEEYANLLEMRAILREVGDE